MVGAATELLQRFRTFGTPPGEFDPNTASPDELARYGLPQRPDPGTHPELARLFRRAFTRRKQYFTAEVAIDEVMSTPDPLCGRRPDFGPSCWGGVIVEGSELPYDPTEPISGVFGQWVVPGILRWQEPAEETLTVACWPGLGGWSEDHVLSAGIATTLTPETWLRPGPSRVEWWAWARMWTNHGEPAVRIANFAVATGDTLSVLVCAPDPERALILFENVTTNQLTALGIEATSGVRLQSASAEWVVEAVSGELPAFSPLTFFNCHAGTTGHDVSLQHGTVTTGYGVGGPLASVALASPSVAVVTPEVWD